MLSRLAQAFACIAASLILPGCGDSRADRKRADVGERIQVVVTLDGGKRTLVARSVRLSEGMTALDALIGVADVRLAPDGLVERINGYTPGRLRPLGPEPSQWICRFNGLELPPGAVPDTLEGGSSLWWDLRRVDAYPRIPVAVGAFPEPFVLGVGPRRERLRIVYGTGLEQEAKRFQEVLKELDPEVEPLEPKPSVPDRLLGRSERGLPNAVVPGRQLLVLGRWNEVRLDRTIEEMAHDPRRYGLTMWFEGETVRRQYPNEEFSTVLPNARAFAWASTLDGTIDAPVVMVVTGLDLESTRAAARALRRGEFRHQLAAAVPAS